MKSESLKVGSYGTDFSRPSADSANLTIFFALLFDTAEIVLDLAFFSRLFLGVQSSLVALKVSLSTLDPFLLSLKLSSCPGPYSVAIGSI